MMWLRRILWWLEGRLYGQSARLHDGALDQSLTVTGVIATVYDDNGNLIARKRLL